MCCQGNKFQKKSNSTFLCMRVIGFTENKKITNSTSKNFKFMSLMGYSIGDSLERNYIYMTSVEST